MPSIWPVRPRLQSAAPCRPSKSAWRSSAVITGIGGGILRDVPAAREPTVLHGGRMPLLDVEHVREFRDLQDPANVRVHVHQRDRAAGPFIAQPFQRFDENSQ